MTQLQATSQPKILIVGDEGICALDLKSHLNQMGYKILANVISGEKALKLIEQDPPDLVLMDIVLKGEMDGVEAADIISSRWGIPVVFVSTYADRDHPGRAKPIYPFGSRRKPNQGWDRIINFDLSTHQSFGYLLNPYQERDIKVTVEMALYISKVNKEKRKAENEIRESEERFRLIAETVEEVFWVADVEIQKMVYISPAYEKIWGRSRKGLYENPQSFLEAIYPEDRDRVLADFELKKIGQPFDHDYRIIRPDGSIRWIWDHGFPIHDKAGKVTRYIGVAQDITERKQTEEALKALSIRDDLTGLYNRRGFFTLAEQGLKSVQRMRTEMLLISGDFDYLKGINDTFGHQEGDRALFDMSRILKETFRESDIIARIGGDEFVILAMNSDEDSAEKLITRFEKALDDHHLQKERPYTLSMSLGIVSFDPQNPCSLDDLLSQADKLMYENKQKKRNQE